MAVCGVCCRALRRFYLQGTRRLLSTASINRCDATTNPESSSDSEGPASEEDVKYAVLEAALDFVPEHGWSRNALVAGAESVGLPSVAHGMFPKGGIELVTYFYRTSNEQLAEQMAAQRDAEQKEDAVQRKTGRIVRDAVVDRLTMIHPFIDKWPQAMALMAMPQNAPHAWRLTGELVDDIWYYAGDTSVDSSWYTKRLSLAAVYKSSEIFMLQDQSEDYMDTWSFVDRRLADVVTIGQSLGKVGQSGDVIKEGLMAASILGRNMLGLNSRQR